MGTAGGDAGVDAGAPVVVAPGGPGSLHVPWADRDCARCALQMCAADIKASFVVDHAVARRWLHAEHLPLCCPLWFGLMCLFALPYNGSVCVT